MKLTPHAIVTLALTAVASVLAALNQVVFHVGSHWYAAITVALVILAAVGAPALAGGAFQGVLDRLVPARWSPALKTIRAVIAALLASGTLALVLNGWSHGVHAAIAVVAALLAGLGFGSPAPAIVAPPAPAVTGPVSPTAAESQRR